MFGRRSSWLLALALVACSSDPPPTTATTEPKTAPADAAVDTVTAIGSNDPDRFTDPDPTRRIGQPPPPPARKGPQRTIDIMLKSSPTGAMAAVDGVQVGITPAYWYGDADGREHEFTFVLRGHAVGRYRFVPIQSGTVHAKLEPVVQDLVIDAGIDPVTQPVTQPAFTPAHPEPPAPIESPPPPDTVVTPVDTAPAGSGSQATPRRGPLP